MTIDYADIHWGDDPEFEEDHKTELGPGEPVGVAETISYAALKGGKPGLYKHEFKPHDYGGKKRRPYLFHGTRSGNVKVDAPPRDTMTLGRAIDVVLSGGERILLSGVWVTTDKTGEQLWLTSPFGLPLQLEKGPIVTRRGIEE